MGHDTTASYMSRLAHLLTALAPCPAPHGQRRVFLPSPGIPPRADDFVRTFADRRTNARAARWRDLALPLAGAHGWRTVDHYALTLPHAHEVMALDSAHYLGTDAIDAVLDDVLAKSGLCG